MRARISYAKIAREWPLWAEYADTSGVMPEAEFYATPEADKLALLVELWGPEDDCHHGGMMPGELCDICGYLA